MLNRETFVQLLREMRPREMAQHSRCNHHVNGMDYLCLHRSDELTVKLYLAEEPVNPHSGYLVHPHSHRYAFGSIVLHGELEHWRFIRRAGNTWDRYRYNPDSRGLRASGTCALEPKIESHRAGSSYWVNPDEIHTLRLREGRTPILIGLAQFRDIKRASELFLPAAAPMERSNERRPTAKETASLAARCLELLDSSLHC